MGPRMKIFVCSRLKGNIENNIMRAKMISRELLIQGHFPLTPHIYFPQFLDESNEAERFFGIEAGLNWVRECDEVWVYDNNISEGMSIEISLAKSLGKPVIYNKRMLLEV